MDREVVAGHAKSTARSRLQTAEERDRLAQARDRLTNADSDAPSGDATDEDILLRAERDRARAAADRAKAAEDHYEGVGRSARRSAGPSRGDARERQSSPESRARRDGRGDRRVNAEVRTGRSDPGDRAGAQNRWAAHLAFIDVDGLKQVNDERGHAAGDLVLKLVVETLRANLRPYDVIVRYGGDEFVCAMPNLSIAAARKRMDRIATLLAASNEGHSITFGLAEHEPADGLTELISRADAGLLEIRRAREDESSR